MPRSPHELPIPKKGNLVLRDGMLIAERDDGQEFGRLMVGEDGLIYNGGEFGVAQKGDPAALNFISSADQPMSGKLSYQHARSDGRGREVAYLGGGRTEDSQPGDMRGQIAVYVANGQEGQREMAFIATSHGTPGRVWTGLKNFVGWMWKFSTAGESGPYSTGGGAASGPATGFYSDDKRYYYNVQGDPTAEFPFGRIVQYATHGSPDPAAWTPVGILRSEPVKPAASPDA